MGIKPILNSIFIGKVLEYIGITLLIFVTIGGPAIFFGYILNIAWLFSGGKLIFSTVCVIGTLNFLLIIYYIALKTYQNLHPVRIN